MIEMHVDEEQLIDFAFDSGLVSKTELKQAQDEAHKTGLNLGEVLVKDGFINEDDLRRIYAQISGTGFVDLRTKELKIEALEIIPESISRKHNVISYSVDGADVQVAALAFEDLVAIEYLKKEKGLKIIPRFTDKESIKNALTTYQKLLKKEFGGKIQKEILKIIRVVSKMGDEKSSLTDLKRVAEDDAVSRVCDLILKHAVYQDATDIHIEPTNKETIIRFRISGVLHEAFSLPQNVHFALVLRFKLLAGLTLETIDIPQDGRFQMETEKTFSNERISFRVSTIPTANGEKITLRVLEMGTLGFTLETLGFHGGALEIIHETLKHSGTLIAAGRAGTGKTTSLYTIIDILNKPSLSIATIENPIEYQMQRITQTEVKNERGFSFVSGLRAILKQDPDVVMVGELNEKEVATLALNASLSNKLILAPVNSESAGGAIESLLELGVEESLVAGAVKTVIGHALIKKLSERNEEYLLSPDQVSKLNKIVDAEKVLSLLKLEKIVPDDASWQTIKFFKSLDDTEDMVGAHEVLKISSAIKDLINKRASGRELESQAIREGMLTLVEDALFKAVSGLTTLEEVFRLSLL